MNKPLISFHVNSYNRLYFLKNLINSFEVCNTYSNVEWIFVDYGSTDGSRDYIIKYSKNANFPVKTIFADENDYFDIIRSYGFAVDDYWQRLRAFLGLYRNQAKKACEGKYIFDLAEDLQFIRRGNWIDEIIDVFRHRQSVIGKQDVISLVPYACYRSRLDKSNNKRSSVEFEDVVPYYVNREKPYVDYSVMQKNMFEKVGDFITPLDFKDDLNSISMWRDKDESLSPWVEYANRSKSLGLVRVFLKYPIITLFPNDIYNKFINNSYYKNRLICKVWTLEEMKSKFKDLDRPISSEELNDDVLYPSYYYNRKNLIRRFLRKIKNFYIFGRLR